LTERKLRLSLLARVNQRTADQVGNAMIAALQELSNRVHTLTAENGKELADHERIVHAL
jgi:IS30 family transposase